MDCVVQVEVHQRLHLMPGLPLPTSSYSLCPLWALSGVTAPLTGLETHHREISGKLNAVCVLGSCRPSPSPNDPFLGLFPAGAAGIGASPRQCHPICGTQALHLRWRMQVMQPGPLRSQRQGCCQESEDRPTWALCLWLHLIAFAHTAPTVTMPCIHVRNQMYKVESQLLRGPFLSRAWRMKPVSVCILTGLSGRSTT